MKKLGHLNRDIASVLARMGHTDCIVVADCGLPIPPGVPCIDLTLQLGLPSFEAVLQSVLADLQVERAVFAREAEQGNAAVAARAQQLAQAGVALDWLPHSEFKQLTRHAKAIIRTGEATPYANVILYSGVIF
jgi:D-ribose pyranase